MNVLISGNISLDVRQVAKNLRPFFEKDSFECSMTYVDTKKKLESKKYDAFIVNHAIEGGKVSDLINVAKKSSEAPIIVFSMFKDKIAQLKSPGVTGISAFCFQDLVKTLTKIKKDIVK